MKNRIDAERRATQASIHRSYQQQQQYARQQAEARLRQNLIQQQQIQQQRAIQQHQEAQRQRALQQQQNIQALGNALQQLFTRSRRHTADRQPPGLAIINQASQDAEAEAIRVHQRMIDPDNRLPAEKMGLHQQRRGVKYVRVQSEESRRKQWLREAGYSSEQVELIWQLLFSIDGVRGNYLALLHSYLDTELGIVTGDAFPYNEISNASQIIAVAQRQAQAKWLRHFGLDQQAPQNFGLSDEQFRFKGGEDTNHDFEDTRISAGPSSHESEQDDSRTESRRGIFRDKEDHRDAGSAESVSPPDRRQEQLRQEKQSMFESLHEDIKQSTETAFSKEIGVNSNEIRRQVDTKAEGAATALRAVLKLAAEKLKGEIESSLEDAIKDVSGSAVSPFGIAKKTIGAAKAILADHQKAMSSSILAQNPNSGLLRQIQASPFSMQNSGPIDAQAVAAAARGATVWVGADGEYYTNKSSNYVPSTPYQERFYRDAGGHVRKEKGNSRYVAPDEQQSWNALKNAVRKTATGLAVDWAKGS
ncbi:hypothetical protein [Neorhodopirellula lusitana]|uniref:hypothetical protein n=1 Tax=Neorhodopirellula lusitana TaxID=445327 RepID=UPI00384E71EB